MSENTTIGTFAQGSTFIITGLSPPSGYALYQLSEGNITFPTASTTTPSKTLSVALTESSTNTSQNIII